MSGLIVLALIAGTLWLAWLWIRRQAQRAERVSRPRALVDAELVYMEKTFRIEHPIRLVAKVDRVYRLADGMLVLVELKSRRAQQARTTDVIQLSAQKMAVEGSTGASVSTVAYVSFVDRAGRPAYVHRRVTLEGASVVAELAQRRHAVLTGLSEPGGPASHRACDTCGFQSTCPRERTKRLWRGGA